MSPPSPLRFVVLYHDQIPEPHYDLMFEIEPGGDLATWRSPRWPIDRETPLTALPAHRAAYLQLEGELSGNRGRVRHVHSGTYRHDEQQIIRFLSPPDGVTIKLESRPDGKWHATPV